MSDVYHQDPPSGGATATDAGRHDATLASLISGIVQDGQKLVTQQLELVRQEIKGDVKRLAYAAALLSVGGVLMLLGALMMVFMLVYLIHEVFNVPQWASYLIVGGVFLLVGAGLLYWAINKLTSASPLPDQSLMGLKENVQWTTNANPNPK